MQAPCAARQPAHSPALCCARESDIVINGKEELPACEKLFKKRKGEEEMKGMQVKGAISVLAAAMLLGAAAGAAALEIQSGNDKVELKLKGHVNRAVMFADDGRESKAFHVDNTNSESRVGLFGKVKASEKLTIGGNFELQWQANPSDKVSMEKESVSGEFVDRAMEVYFDFKQFGKISLGKGKMASDESVEVDLSGTDLAGNVGVADVGGGLKFNGPASLDPTIDADGNVVDKRLSVGNVFDQMDGLSKKNRVRYDSPALAGFSIGLSAGEKDMADATLNYSGDFSGAKLEGVLAFVNPGSGKDYSQIDGSVSALFDFGLSLTAASGSRSMDNLPAGGDDPVYSYGKIGWKCDKLLPYGSTAVSVDYGVYENIKHQDKGEEGTAYGVQLVQKLADWSTELFAAYRNFALEDGSGASYDDISLVMAGARLKF
jgi:predicted porin